MSPSQADLDRLEDVGQLRRMRFASLVEGATLVALVFVAVPLKRLAGLPEATSILGPIHGMTFLLYVWMLIQTVSGGGWSKRETGLLILAAFLPFGAFASERMLRRKEAALREPA